MELLIYLLKVSACTTLFFAFYLLVLKHLTFFKINRFYLLSTLLLSFLIPALQINIERQVEPVLVETPVLQANPHQLESVKMNDLVVAPMPIAKENFDWVSLLPLIYGLIAGVLLLICAWQLHQLIRQTKKTSNNFNGLKLISKSTGFTNCSFFNYVFINESILTETELMVLLQHERVHATQYHSIDKLILMLFKAVLWFNPIAYLYDKALEQTHEYEADEATSQHFGNQPYAQLLLKLAIAKSEIPLIHNFVKSPVKERIKMLFNPKSNHMKKLMYFMALPIGLSLIWIFAVEVVYAESNVLKTDLIKNEVNSTSSNAFIEVKFEKFTDGHPAAFVIVKSPNGKKMTTIGEVDVKVKFLINDKIYTLEEAKKFDQKFLNQLSSQQGHGLGKIFDDARIDHDDSVFWFGKEPKLKNYEVKNRAISLKYTGSILFGKVVSYTYAPQDKNLMNGFLLKLESGEQIKIYIHPQFASQVNKQILLGDPVKVKAFNAFYAENTKYPVIGSSTIVKNDKVIFDRNRFVIDDRKENTKTDWRTLAAMEYQASDSVMFSEDRRVVDLYGNVLLALDSIKLSAEYVNVNNNTKIITAKNAQITSPYNKLDVKASLIYYYLNTKTYKLLNDDQGSTKVSSNPRILTSKSISGNIKTGQTKFEDAEVDILGGNLKAELVELNRIKQTVLAKNGVFVKDGKTIKAKNMVFYLKNGNYIFSDQPQENKNFNKNN